MSDCWEPDVFDVFDGLYLSPEKLQQALDWGSTVWLIDPTADPTAVAEALGLL